MKVRTVCTVLLCVALISGVGFATPRQYQSGKILKAEKEESHSHSGGTDAPLKEEVTTLKVSIQLGDKVYVCRYKTHLEDAGSWLEGKDVEARISGRTIYVRKANGKEANGAIVSIAPAEKP
jgi:hypothetical protein